MFSTDSFQHVSLMALALAARRIAAGIMRGEVSIREIEDPARWWAGSVHPERGYDLICRGETVAEIVEHGGQHWAEWTVPADPEGADAFRSALVSEAGAAHAVAETVRSLEADGCSIDGAGTNRIGQAVGADPVAWLEYEDESGFRDRVYFHGAYPAEACMRWARARRLA